MNTKRVTRQTVEQWLEANRPNLATYYHGKNKGVYDKNAGPAHSFTTRGQTWREVLESFTAR